MSIATDGTTLNWAENTGTPPYIAFPITIACWFQRSADAPGTLVVLGERDDITPTTLESFELGVTTAGDITAKASDDISGSSATATGVDDTATWHHACGVWISATERYAYFDGTKSTVSIADKDPTALLAAPAARIGAKMDGSIRFNGLTAHIAVWSVALSDGEVAGLAGGDNPLAVQSANLEMYWPTTDSGDAGNDAIGTYDLTFSDTADYFGTNPSVDPAPGGAAPKASFYRMMRTA